MSIRTHSAGLTADPAKLTTPYQMNGVPKGWLSEFGVTKNPFFFYLHYNEPHGLYYPLHRWIDACADEISMSHSVAAEFALEVQYDLDEIAANGCELAPGAWEGLVAMYEPEIAYIDEKVRLLVDYLDSLELQEPIVVVTANHGELFGGHGLLAHKCIRSDAVIRVLPITRKLHANLADEDDLVQRADVMTPILSIVGADATNTSGVDLRTDARWYALSQRSPQTFEKQLLQNPSFDTSRFPRGLPIAIRLRVFRHRESEDRCSLNTLPDGEMAASEDHPDVSDRLRCELRAWIDKFGGPTDEARPAKFSDAAKRQLKDLRYPD